MTNSHRETVARRLHFGLLWGASLMVPSPRRSEWSEEWRTELWYVLRECSSITSLDPRSMLEATAFCIGAYRDAIWLRKRAWQNRPPLARFRGSAVVCLLFLIATFFSAWSIEHISARVSAVKELSRIRVYALPLSEETIAPSDCSIGVRAHDADGSEFEDEHHCFDAFSHYRIGNEMVWGKGVPKTQWIIAHASAGFFEVLHLPVRFIDAAKINEHKLPHIVLSEETWNRNFGGDAKIVGTHLRVRSVDAVIAGVASRSASSLPGNASAWLVDADSSPASDGPQFVAGHLTSLGYFRAGPRWALSLFGIILAALLVPYIVHSTIGGYCEGAPKPSLMRRGRFWAFLVAKIAILLAIVYFSSVDLSSSLAQPSSLFSGLVQGISAFALCLWGLSWALRDQQQRCPVCLRRMCYPVEVGQVSRTFLSWNGTELVCERGHVLLHIPEIPTSWFGARRWVCLDRSWQFLFSGPS